MSHLFVFSMITQEEIQERFEYKDDGSLYYRYDVGRGKKGNRFGSWESDGYRRGRFNHKKYREHSLIFLYHYGYIPEEIDHIDKNPRNNKIENLRECTRSQNQMNTLKRKEESLTSQYKGVHKRDDTFRTKPWIAEIQKDGKKHHLGYFRTEDEAAQAYNKSAIELFGDFANLNIIGGGIDG